MLINKYNFLIQYIDATLIVNMNTFKERKKYLKKSQIHARMLNLKC